MGDAAWIVLVDHVHPSASIELLRMPPCSTSYALYPMIVNSGLTLLESPYTALTFSTGVLD